MLPSLLQVMGDIDVKGKDWNGQLKLGTPQFLGEHTCCCGGVVMLLSDAPY